MKQKLFLIAVLACGFSASPGFGETLKLRTAPDQAHLLIGSDQDVTIKIDLTAAPGTRKKRTPLNLAVVLDRSGSMAGAKIEKARQAAMMAVDQMAPGDIFSMVVYDNTADVLVPAQPVDDKEAIKARIEHIRPGGSTALYAGVERGARELKVYLSDKRINRILLLSDGLANVGPSRPGELRVLGRQLSEQGISVSTIGVGDDYNEDLMSGIAEASDANYYYVKDAEKLPEIFAKELGSLAGVAAREIQIEVTCPEGVHPLGFLGRPEKFQNQRAVVRLSGLSPGENRSLLLRCRPGEPAAAKCELAAVKVSYLDEMENGRECSATEMVSVHFTADPRAAQASANQEVITQRELMWNAIRKDEAIAEADAGRLVAAAQKLSAQAEHLAAQLQSAPAEARSQLDLEVRNLRNRAQELQQGQYGSASRKMMQSESWNSYNSKPNP